MKKNNFNIIFLSAVLILSSSCSTYKVKNEIEKGDRISKLKSSGIILRIHTNNRDKMKEATQNLSFWIEGHKRKNKLKIINEPDTSLGIYNSDFERFYQLSINNRFLKYKSIGVIKLYLRNNREKLEKILAENSMDSLIIYEIDSIYSLEMQFIEFNSVISVIDTKMNILYLDHQKDVFNINGFEETSIKKQLQDKISQRFIEKMIDIEFMDSDGL